VTCPNCALSNVDSAEFCDCGFSFTGAPSRNLVTNEERTWTVFLHLAGLLSFVNIGLGTLIMLGLWLVKRREFAFLRESGRLALNYWLGINLIKMLVAGAGALGAINAESLTPSAVAPVLYALNFFLAATTVMIYLGCLYAILAAVKANEGKLFSYPGAIPLLRPSNPTNRPISQ